MEMLVDISIPSRELKRRLRRSVSASEGVLPESVAWQSFLELQRRDEPDASQLFIGVLRNLHTRRSIAGVELPMVDSLPDEHRMAEDSFLADLWKAYKKCIANNRTGPASLLLRDIEEQINAL
ncbi:MAG: hypothetical protein HN348_12960 [Proteobacteria bacterium]|mgnify:CR=1 FL=1|jgi:hypothetical protein|nr:hypothetical protein [Pseudomonadota bacterium]